MTTKSSSIKNKIVAGLRELDGQNDGQIVRQQRENKSYNIARKMKIACNVINVTCIAVAIGFASYTVNKTGSI